MAKIAVVTPTFNERNNIPVLIEKIFSLKMEDLNLYVVDDNSPDGTAEVVRGLSQVYPVELISRPRKEGLGRAYTAAFNKILSGPERPDYIVQMDADLSHDPAIIPNMIAKMGECDAVLGSRYIKNGGVKNWGWVRRQVSRLGNIYARLVLDLPYHDLTSGFKCWKRTVLEKIDLNNLSSVGYNFQIETTYRAYKLGFKICETPIVFIERKSGVSKFNLGIIGESFIKILVLKYEGLAGKIKNLSR